MQCESSGGGSEMKLPQKLMDEFKDEVQGCRFFGHKLEDFSKEELMTCVVMMGKQLQDAEKRHEHEMETLELFNRPTLLPPPPPMPVFGLFGLVR